MKSNRTAIFAAIFVLAAASLACQALSTGGADSSEPAGGDATDAAPAQPPADAGMPVIEDSDTTIQIISDGDFVTLYGLKNEDSQDESYKPTTERYSVDLTSETQVDIAAVWCAKTASIRDDNEKHFDPAVTINDYLVPDSKLEYFTWETDDGLYCFSWDIVASNWPVGEHQVTEAFTLDAAINDGWDDYAAGEYVTEYAVSVTEGASLVTGDSPAADACLSWDEITASMKGETVCFRGIITRYDTSTGMARYYFSDKSGSVFIFSVKYEIIDPNTGKTIAPGTCVELSAPVRVEGERPAINVDPILDDDSGASGEFTFYEDKSACE